MNINTSRSGLKQLKDEAARRSEAVGSIKMLLAPRDATTPIYDSMVPDVLVTDSMVSRYLAIDPPSFFVTADFERIAYEIERAFVLGEFFSAVAAACVTIERVLNSARMALHKHHSKIKDLWSKGPTNDWRPSIEALKQWKYLDDTHATNLVDIYENIRCHYLHSGVLEKLESDAQTSINEAYYLVERFFGFPTDLFEYSSGGIKCKDEKHPLFLEFYAPNITETSD